MFPTTSALFLLSLGAVTAFGSRFQDAFSALSNDAAQAPYASNRAKPMTISSRGDTSLVHQAEVATADVAVSACHSIREEAERNAHKHLERLRADFAHQGLNSTISSPISVRQRDGNDFDEYGSTRSFHKIKDVQDGNSTEEETSKHCASALLAVTVEDFDLLPILSGNMNSALANARLRHVGWDFSEATQVIKKSELRRQAYQHMIRTGQDYATAFDLDGLIPVEFSEEYSSVSVKRDVHRQGRTIWYSDEHNADLSVPDLEMIMRFSCKFAI